MSASGVDRCHVLDWAACGAMALTGPPDGAAVTSPAPALSLLRRVAGQLAEVTRQVGREVRADPAELIAGRAGLSGFTRRGQASAGGSSRLLATADGWCAVTLSRADDIAAVPALLAILGAGTGGEPASAQAAWAMLGPAAGQRTARELADGAQLLGIPAATLPRQAPAPACPAASSRPQEPPWPPWRAASIAARSPGASLRGAVVADLSSMWAGPLCARLLGLAGARVIKVESADRLDGARSADQRFYDWLHAGHESLVIPFRTGRGRSVLARLLSVADVVIEASRPRALAQLGLAPGSFWHREGQVWLSITGYGRDHPERVAFGDDAAVAGGLVGQAADGKPVFCADAIADPLTGITGALAIARSVAAGGGELLDLPMRAVAASFAAATAPDHGQHDLSPDGSSVTCRALGRRQAVLPPRPPTPAPGRAAAPGADTEAISAWLESV
ncbi:MAG TPA: CoA transferase [Trebonia sp.]|nr:CoA transferase [Trebonia sp.]